MSVIEQTDNLFNYLTILAKSNIKYKWWFEGDIIDKNGPFYYENEKVPNIEQMQKEGINCAGLINICFRYLEIKLPTEGGGTDGWFLHYSKKLNMFPINLEFIYPVGTILLRNYSSEQDQGHLAIVYDSTRKIKDTKIIHAYCCGDMNRILNDPGIVVEDFSVSHAWFKNGTYTHVLLPCQWMK